MLASLRNKVRNLFVVPTRKPAAKKEIVISFDKYAWANYQTRDAE